MKNTLLLKIGQGKSVHIGRTGVNQSGKEYTITHCGSEVSSRGVKQPRVIGTIENADQITCKKCRKAYEEQRKREAEESALVEEMIENETAKPSNGVAFEVKQISKSKMEIIYDAQSEVHCTNKAEQVDVAKEKGFLVDDIYIDDMGMSHLVLTLEQGIVDFVNYVNKGVNGK